MASGLNRGVIVAAMDKPSNPKYSGGEDEATANEHGHTHSRPTELPVDETDEGPSTAKPDIGED
jgi:hypothetical protein